MFIQPSEQLIIMDLFDCQLTVAELKALKAAGVETIYAQGAVRWDEIQPTASASCDWHKLDAMIERYSQAGLKVLLPQLYHTPKWKPEGWHYTHNIPNMRNQQVGWDIDEWTDKIIGRYGSDNLQVVYSIAYDGEFPDNITTTFEHPFPPEVISAFVTYRMMLLETQFSEVWTMFHSYGQPPYIEYVYSKLHEVFPDSKHYRFQFTHFPHGGWQTAHVADYSARYGITHFVGSEYCTGLLDNRGAAIAQGVKLLTAPIHPYQPARRLEPWMLAAIEQTIGMMSNA